MNKYAPIALFTYSRADHTKEVVESLLQNKEAAESDLYIFSDGPKSEEKRNAVEENRAYIHTITGFKSIKIVEHEKNQGLANSLITGITEVISKHGKVIVVEDDLILSPFFLKYMNDALEKYENEDKVSAITAYCPINDEKLPETFFLRYFHCWGWATWKRGWELMNLDTKELLRKIRWKTKKFNFDGAMNNYGMLYCQKVGLVDSWFIRLYASFFLEEKLTLFPGHSLVSNHGLDGSGTHRGKPANKSGDDGVDVNLQNAQVYLQDISIEENAQAYNLIRDTLITKRPRTGIIKKRYIWFKSFIRRLFYIDCI